MEWVGRSSAKGVVEREFRLDVEGRVVPGVLWSPESPRTSTPLVLIGHGGSGHKKEDHLVSLARRLVRHDAIAAVSIDGPIHGDRKPAGVEGESQEASRRRLVAEGVADRMVEDWRGTLDRLRASAGFEIGRVGYWGLSMGTLFGVPYLASEPGVDVAVLGLMGTGLLDGDRMRRDAEKIQCPILFLQQWDDELIPRDSSSALFEAIASPDKRLHANPGLHSAVPPDEFLATQGFLARVLNAP